MSATTSAPTNVDVGALAGEISIDAARRVAELIVVTIDVLDNDGRSLNQLQNIELVQEALRAFDGFERACAETVAAALEGGGVSVRDGDVDADTAGRAVPRRVAEIRQALELDRLEGLVESLADALEPGRRRAPLELVDEERNDA
jgi:hypothetical protein